MNNTIRRVPTYLFLVLITLFLTNCSSGNSPTLGEGILTNPTDTPVLNDTPPDTDTPTDASTSLACSDDSTCPADQKCVEGSCRKKHMQFDDKKILGLFTLNKTCNVGQHECSESEYCQSNHPNSKSGTCQNKKELNALCNSDFECLSNACTTDHNEKTCSDSSGANAPATELKYYLSSSKHETLLSKYTDYSTWDVVNPKFEPVKNACVNYGNNTSNAIVALKVIHDGNGIKDIQTVCQDINGTIKNHSNLSAEKTIYDRQESPKDYFIADPSSFISGFWVKDANEAHAVVELHPYLTKIETLKPLISNEILSPISWGPGDGAIESFNLKCSPGYAMTSIGGRLSENYYRSLELECRKIEIAIKTGSKDEKK